MEVYALRVKAAPFGHNAPLRSDLWRARSDQPNVTTTRASISANGPLKTCMARKSSSPARGPCGRVQQVIYLDASYDKILPDSWIVVDTSVVENSTRIARTRQCTAIGRESRLGSSELSRAPTESAANPLGLNSPLQVNDQQRRGSGFASKDSSHQAHQQMNFRLFVTHSVYAQSEKLDLAEEPIEEADLRRHDQMSIHA